MKNLQCRIMKLKKEIEKVEFEGLIIDRSKSQQVINTRTDQLDEEFQKEESSEEIPELESDGDQYSEGLGDVLPGNEKLDPPHSKMLGWCEKEKEERPKR